MALERPSLPTIRDRISTDIESTLPGADARTRRSVFGVLAAVFAGAVHGLYGFLVWISRNAIPDLAEGDALERWARIWLRSGRIGSASATGTVTFTGLNGLTIPQGAVVVRADGARFFTTQAVTISSGTADATVLAEMAGAAGNTDAGTVLAMAAQVAGIAATATVAAAGISSGADVETDSSLRTRMLQRIQKPPQGGATNDYEEWALEVAGVTRVWVKPLWMGPSTVGVIFVRDGDASILPDDGEIAAVQAHIEALRPVTAKVYVLAPTMHVVDISISVSPNTPTVQAAVLAELQDMFRREAEPGKAMRIGYLHEAVSAAAGEIDHVITSPASDVAMGPAEMAQLGTVTWV